MFIIFNLLFIYFLFFFSGLGISYLIFRNTKIKKIIFPAAALIGVIFIVLFIIISGKINGHLQSIKFIPIYVSFFITIINSKKLFNLFIESKKQYFIIFLYSFIGSLIPLIPHIINNQFGFYNLGNSEFMAFSDRASKILNLDINTIIYSQFDRYGTSLLLAFISSIINKSPTLIIQLFDAFLHMSVIAMAFGALQIINDNFHKLKLKIGIIDYIIFGLVIIFSGIEYQHFSLSFLAAHLGLSFFLLIILLISNPSILHNKKIAISFGAILAILSISYPEIALPCLTLILISVIINLLVNIQKKSSRNRLTNYIKALIAMSATLIIVLLIINPAIISDIFIYAVKNSSDQSIGFNIFGNPKSDFSGFLSRIVGFQFWDAMDISPVNSWLNIIIGIVIIIFILATFILIGIKENTTFLIIPVIALIVFSIGQSKENYYLFSKFIFLSNTTSLIFLYIGTKLIKKYISLIILILFLIFNTYAVWQHAKYYLINNSSQIFFSENQVNKIKKIVNKEQYDEIIINSSDPGLWIFFLDNDLPVREDVARNGNAKVEIANYLKEPKNKLMINFANQDKRFINLSINSQEQMGDSIYIIRPSIIKDKVIRLTEIKETKHVDIPKSKSFIADNGNIKICNGGFNAKLSRIINVKKFANKSLLIYSSSQSLVPGQEFVSITNIYQRKTFMSKRFEEKELLITSFNDWKKLGDLNRQEKRSFNLIEYKILQGSGLLDIGFENIGKELGCIKFSNINFLIIQN